MKKMIIAILMAGILFPVFSQVDLKTDFQAGSLILASDMNQNFLDTETTLNSLLEQVFWNALTGDVGINFTGGYVGIGTADHDNYPLTVKSQDATPGAPIFRVRSTSSRSLELYQPDPADETDPFVWHTANALQWKVDGIPVFEIDPTGNVLVGSDVNEATTRGGALTVENWVDNGIGGSIRIINDSATYPETMLYMGRGYNDRGIRLRQDSRIASGSDPFLHFESQLYGDTGFQTNMTIKGFENDPRVGIGTTAPAYALDVIGQIRSSDGVLLSSDNRYKKDILPISSVLSKLKGINGVNFTWDQDEYPDKKFSTGSQIGLIAQEVEKEFPELVNTDETGYKAVSYDRFTAVLLQAIKEQQELISSLTARIDELETKESE